MTREELLAAFADPIPVGSHGFVRLVDVMGDDAAVCQAARISYGSEARTPNEDRGLIRYMLRHKHGSPFEQASIKLHVQVPMDVWRQWIRHRTAKPNEYSTRYREAIDDIATTAPDAWRLQDPGNKQGSNGMLTEWPEGWMEGADGLIRDADGSIVCGKLTPGEYLSRAEADFHELARAIYQERLALGVAREQARKDLPLSNYTAAYWTMDLRNLLGFLELRLDSHAQLEIRQFAEAIASIVKVWVPWTWEAFEDYALGAHTFSRQEMAVLRYVVALAVGDAESAAQSNGDSFSEREDAWKSNFRDLAPDLTQRERKAFLAALGRLEGLDG